MSNYIWPEDDSGDVFSILTSRFSDENDYFTKFSGPKHPPYDHTKPIEYFSIGIFLITLYLSCN